MAMLITTDCISCGACEPDCPNEAITAGDSIYVIDVDKCTECVGAFDTPSAWSSARSRTASSWIPTTPRPARSSKRSTPACTDRLSAVSYRLSAVSARHTLRCVLCAER